MVICRECGTQNPTGSKFCNRCGAALPPATRLLCPQCETPNPPDRLYCDQCGARLVHDDLPKSPADDSLDRPPGRSREPFSLPQRPAGQTGDLEVSGEIPDWLRTGETENPPPAAADEPAGESTDKPAAEEIPDWLRDAPEPLTVDDALESDEFESSDAEWLSDFTALVEPDAGVDATAAQEPAAEEPAAEEPAVIESADAEQTTAAEPTETAEQPPGPETEEQVPDWLASIVGIDESAPEPAPAAPGAEEPAAEEEVPAWLAALQDEEEETVAPDDALPTAADISAAPETETPPAAASLAGEEEAGAPEVSEPEDAGKPDPEMPGWLAALEAEDAAGDLAYAREGLPDWLADISSAEEGILPVDEENLAELETLDELFEQPPESEPADLLPDALAGKADRAAAENEEVWDESAGSFDEWVTALDTPLDEEVEPAAEPEIDFLALDDEDLPDWLLEPVDDLAADLPVVDEEADSAPAEDVSAEVYPYEELFAEDLPVVGEEEVEPAGPVAPPPEEEKPERKPVTGELTNVPSQLVSADLPEWLKDNPLAVELPEEDTPLAEVPDWLQPAGEDVFDELLALDEAEAAALASSGEWAALLGDLPAADQSRAPEESLSTADIPEWLEAMRPAETSLVAEEAAPDAAPEPAPQAGPLAGLAGVIHIEPMVASPRVAERPPTEFSISPEQRQQVALLRQLMTEERRPPAAVTPLRKRDLPSPLRIVLGFLLLVVVGLGLFLPVPIETALPESPAVLPVEGAVSAAANRPVLVAFEYTPAMAGELTPQAVTLLAELAAQNSPVMLVSQSAAGLTIGEEVAQAVNGLSPETLALVPGEAIGLRQLGNCLAGPATCATLYGQSLTDAQRAAFADLGLILVFAAERDGLISWMEQVSPQVDVPLVAGVTQALAPVAMPYFNSEQVQGLIGGFPAAVAYEQATGQVGEQSDMVWAVTLAQWLAVAVLIVGNVFWVLEGAVQRDA